MNDKEVGIIANFIDWFLSQYACGIDIERSCLLIGRNGRYEDALEVYMREDIDEN